MLYAYGGKKPLFEVIGSGEPSLWTLHANNATTDSSIFRLEVINHGDVYGLDDQDRVVVEARKPGRDGFTVFAWPVDDHECGIVDVNIIVYIVSDGDV